jgi:hypothetical protein
LEVRTVVDVFAGVYLIAAVLLIAVEILDRFVGDKDGR